jgi:hypothetical protein
MADSELVNVVALVDQIQPALQRNDRAKVNGIVAQLIAQRAPMGDQWQQLALIAAGYGEHRMASEAIDMFVDHWGGRPSAQFKKVSVLSLLNKWDEAHALLQTIPEGVPDTASHIYRRGTAALNLGNIQEARGHFERLTRMRPQSGFTWLSLSMAVDFSQEPELAERLAAGARSMDGSAPLERGPYFYAMGKAYADRGQHAAAFDAFANGARAMKTMIDYKRDEDRVNAERAIDGYTADRVAAIASQQREPTGRTIFVTGLPRSGTTLVEQILTSHSAITDGGETNRLMLLSNEVGGTSWSALAGYAEAPGVAPAARLWAHWQHELFPAPGRVIDKTLNTSRFLGLAASLLPEAPLIWMTRDPLDCAWSCYRTSFSGSAIPWSYDLQDIAAHFRLEDQLLARWRLILGERLLVLPYEALVTDPEPWIRRILEHCGLAEESQVFAPHENKRPVATASMVQVRRPINRVGIGAAEPYREFLKPFIEAYYG